MRSRISPDSGGSNDETGMLTGAARTWNNMGENEVKGAGKRHRHPSVCLVDMYVYGHMYDFTI